MNYKKFFMPIGGGDELEERVFGALLVAKHFNVHLEILHSVKGVKLNRELPSHIIEELEEFAKENQIKESKKFNELLLRLSNQTSIKISQTPLENEASVHPLIQLGDRSSMVEQESKFCDIVVAAAPQDGISTSTFEASVLHSGKSVIVIPRVMKSFKTENILIAWNNSQEASRSVTSSIDILKQAKKVHLVSSKEYLPSGDNLDKIKSYLACHGIKVEVEFLKTTLHPGEALLKKAHEENFDMIVIGAYGHKGLKEIMFGGATKYLLNHSKVPMFMSH